MTLERGCGSIDCVNECGGDFTWATCPNVLNRLRTLKAIAETEAAIRLADKALARLGTAEDGDFDVCACGDYRHQHVNGTGRCKLDSLCTPTPCGKFRLFRAANND